MTRSKASAWSAASTSSGVRANVSVAPARRAVSRIRATKKRSLTTATALIVLLRVAQPVLVPLGQVSERREVPHPVDVHDAVEMIRLVLDHPSEELLRHGVDLAAIPIVGLEPDRRVAGHYAAHVRHGEASLPAVVHLLGERRHDRVDEDGERNGGRVGIARVLGNLDHADLLERVHLRRGEAGPVVLAHGLDHVVDEPLSLRRPDLLHGNERRLLAQHRVAETGDLQNSHVTRVLRTRIVARGSRRTYRSGPPSALPRQQRLYLRPEPHGHGSLRPTFSARDRNGATGASSPWGSPWRSAMAGSRSAIAGSASATCSMPCSMSHCTVARASQRSASASSRSSRALALLGSVCSRSSNSSASSSSRSSKRSSMSSCRASSRTLSW